jgi:hypothetical protein
MPSANPQPHTPPGCPPVLGVFLRGAPQITGDARFADHRGPDGTVDWAGVLAEAGWSDGQRMLIQLAAALCGEGHVPAGSLGAHLTGSQTSLVLAMCQASRR